MRVELTGILTRRVSEGRSDAFHVLHHIMTDSFQVTALLDARENNANGPTVSLADASG
jgi:hypothetical protein